MIHSYFEKPIASYSAILTGVLAGLSPDEIEKIDPAYSCIPMNLQSTDSWRIVLEAIPFVKEQLLQFAKEHRSYQVGTGPQNQSAIRTAVGNEDLLTTLRKTRWARFAGVLRANYRGRRQVALDEEF